MDAPWRTVELDRLPRLPAMLGGEERQFLYWLGKEYEDKGPLIDLGTFLGASAACLAAGLADAPHSSSKVYSYDLFTYGPWCQPYDIGEGWTNGGDILPWVKHALSPWSDRIVLVKGDICEQRWSGDPLSVLFVDFTQNWRHHNHVCRAFLPHLRVGGVLAHQDYVYVLCYWLHVFMERWRDHFEQLSPLILNATAAWRYVDPLPRRAFEIGLQQDLTFDQMLALIDRSIERYQGIYRGMLRLARARFFLHAKGPAAAEAEARLVERDCEWPELSDLLEQARQEFARWPRSGGPYAGFFRD